jgi:hypothetical protein
MSVDAARAQLLAEYAAALEAEKVLWQKAHDTAAPAAERANAHSQWEAAALRTRELGALWRNRLANDVKG